MFSRRHFLCALLSTTCAGSAAGWFAGAAVYFVICGILGIVALSGLWHDSWRHARVVGGFLGMFLGAVAGYEGATWVDGWVMKSANQSALELVPALEQCRKDHGMYPGKLSDLPGRTASAYLTYSSTSDSFKFTIHRTGMFLDVWEWGSENRVWRET